MLEKKIEYTQYVRNGNDRRGGGEQREAGIVFQKDSAAKSTIERGGGG